MKRTMGTPPGDARRAGFTLVELLVVMGIISALTSFIMPAIQQARRRANTARCASNLRQVALAMHTYATDFGGAIPGSAHTSARFLFTDVKTCAFSPLYNEDNVPGIVQVHDWASPLARYLGIAIDEGATRESRVCRFESLRTAPVLRCPDNNTEAVSFGAVDFPTGPMLSYNAALGFLVTRNYTGTNAEAAGAGTTIAFTYWNVPPGYSPKLGAIGDGTRKIFVADGSRYSRHDAGPDASLEYAGYMGGGFADQGAATKFTRSWHRGLIPGNGFGGADTRAYWARHGTSSAKPNCPAGQYKLNAVFYDGHVELLDDIEIANPALWFPRGTEFTVNGSQVWNDSMQKYFGGKSQVYLIP